MLKVGLFFMFFGMTFSQVALATVDQDPCLIAGERAILAYARAHYTNLNLNDPAGFYYNDEDGEQGPVVLASIGYTKKNGQECKFGAFMAYMKGEAGKECLLLPPVIATCNK